MTPLIFHCHLTSSYFSNFVLDDYSGESKGCCRCFPKNGIQMVPELKERTLIANHQGSGYLLATAQRKEEERSHQLVKTNNCS
ncbi:hypothetical protein MPTK1_5g15010 [Marchantia polymorpha subsp. ruderalis]|uniref:Uncharacterized protein n=2 Tax=Marchantia polymorpha TaxID=3197 RepID=A0AAF6BII2_MARPO|nr:hypothetical protein MARPO_0071s0109 [Marchantia polymorpha]BBN11816.1 hypothetical protein Mp_5g15010 [Marchantia polymorpha subsp. ruderalis]|eukprot:PTQ35506.1 hypothetical protein MARPO_0071s0109 [Marchantia polymorpha]